MEILINLISYYFEAILIITIFGYSLAFLLMFTIERIIKKRQPKQKSKLWKIEIGSH